MTRLEALQVGIDSLKYNQETGELVWVKGRSDRVGKVAGNVDSSGYRKIMVKATTSGRTAFVG